jgi:hypothetical protein
MVMGETAEGTLLERSLHELADVYEVLSLRLWQALVEEDLVGQVNAARDCQSPWSTLP